MIEMRKKSSKLSTVFAFSGTKQSKSIIVHNFLIFMLVNITFIINNWKIAEVLENFKIHEKWAHARTHAWLIGNAPNVSNFRK